MRTFLIIWTIVTYWACQSSPKAPAEEIQPTSTIDRIEAPKVQREAPSISDSLKRLAQQNAQLVFRTLYTQDSALKSAIIDTLLQVDGVPRVNRQFLMDLQHASLHARAIDYPIQGVYRFNSEDHGILSPTLGDYPLRNPWERKLVDALQDSFHVIYEREEGGEIAIPYTYNLKSIESHKPIYVLHQDTFVRANATHFSYRYEECVYWSAYRVSGLDTIDSVSIASRYPLQLENAHHPDFTQVMQSAYKNAMVDCPSSEEDLVIFKRFEGLPDLYLARADTYPINDSLNGPSRMLVYSPPNQLPVALWYADFDQFGCGCY